MIDPKVFYPISTFASSPSSPTLPSKKRAASQPSGRSIRSGPATFQMISVPWDTPKFNALICNVVYRNRLYTLVENLGIDATAQVIVFFTQVAIEFAHIYNKVEFIQTQEFTLHQNQGRKSLRNSHRARPRSCSEFTSIQSPSIASSSSAFGSLVIRKLLAASSATSLIRGQLIRNDLKINR